MFVVVPENLNKCVGNIVIVQKGQEMSHKTYNHIIEPKTHPYNSGSLQWFLQCSGMLTRITKIRVDHPTQKHPLQPPLSVKLVLVVHVHCIKGCSQFKNPHMTFLHVPWAYYKSGDAAFSIYKTKHGPANLVQSEFIYNQPQDTFCSVKLIVFLSFITLMRTVFPFAACAPLLF